MRAAVVRAGGPGVGERVGLERLQDELVQEQRVPLGQPPEPADRRVVDGAIERADLTAYTRVTDTQLAFFAELFGPYPFDRYGLALTDSVAGLAMETQGLSLFSAADLDAYASRAVDKITTLARRASRFGTFVLLFAVLACGIGFLLGLAACGGGEAETAAGAGGSDRRGVALLRWSSP